MKTSLEDLQNKLQHWRTSCKHPGRVPSAIKEQIVGILKYYSRLQVSKATGLPPGAFLTSDGEVAILGKGASCQ